ncbi:MAG: methyltransferase domain-containing protein [Sulfurimonadaceae bacterium]|nr:class I SAM-dependent methyltransferase [Candidatus Cloacimonadota bacterium]
MANNIDKKTVEGFGEEWSRFSQDKLEVHEHDELFSKYFINFPFEKFGTNVVAADIGCGSGRWAKQVAPKVGILYCVDASSEALDVARGNLKGFENVVYLNQSVNDMTIPEESLDFAYSLGVLHHIPSTLNGIKASVSKLKKGGYFLVYLYYYFDNKPIYFRYIWKVSDIFRKFVSKLPAKLKFFICDMIALLVYLPLGKLSWILEKIGVNVSNIPLSFYKDTSFYTMRTDSLDRFGTQLEQRFTKEQIAAMMRSAGLCDIIFNEDAPYWVAIGKKQ